MTKEKLITFQYVFNFCFEALRKIEKENQDNSIFKKIIFALTEILTFEIEK